jgi:ureidoacrylate peracid hydrolase
MHRICFPRSATRRLFVLRDRFRTLEDINPRRSAHIVINMQNAFLSQGGSLEIPTAREIVPNINRISKALRAAGGSVILIQNTADASTARRCSNYWSSSKAIQKGIVDCFISGRQAHGLWPGLHLDPSDLRVPKHHFSAFAAGSSPLHDSLEGLVIDTLIITGTPTNICCESTARDALSFGYKVIFVYDATASLDDEGHNATLGNMLVMSADVMCTNEVLTLIERRASCARVPKASIDASCG